jgi:hypothetical protein
MCVIKGLYDYVDNTWQMCVIKGLYDYVNKTCHPFGNKGTVRLRE